MVVAPKRKWWYCKPTARPTEVENFFAYFRWVFKIIIQTNSPVIRPKVAEKYMHCNRQPNNTSVNYCVEKEYRAEVTFNFKKDYLQKIIL